MALGIKTAMRQKGISGEAIAQYLGQHKNTAYNKLNGETEFLVGEALRMQADLFPEYSLSYLFSDTEEKEASQRQQPLTG